MLLIADNLQLTRPSMARMVAHRDSAAFQPQVARLTAAGAEAIDINTGPLDRDGADQMIFCLQAASNATGLPLLIDTLNPVAIRAGLSLGLSN
jgi:5-methyltetrahydrofolate corrinoid/iron sulfur protein methyltransferase